jgi:hypothetical protein
MAELLKQLVNLFFINCRFLLSEVQLLPAGMTSALEILARLARHSREIASSIACTPKLLDYIVKNFVPLSMSKPGLCFWICKMLIF